jgi:hypothetical protein
VRAGLKPSWRPSPGTTPPAFTSPAFPGSGRLQGRRHTDGVESAWKVHGAHKRRATLGTVSNVWKTRNRLLLEQLEQLTERLRGEATVEPAEIEEQAVRLLASVVMLLRQHHTNKRGQCKYCGWTRWARRFWHRRPRCTVYRSVDFAMRQPLRWVWWQLSHSTAWGACRSKSPGAHRGHSPLVDEGTTAATEDPGRGPTPHRSEEQ